MQWLIRPFEGRVLVLPVDAPAATCGSFSFCSRVHEYFFFFFFDVRNTTVVHGGSPTTGFVSFVYLLLKSGYQLQYKYIEMPLRDHASHLTG